MSQVSEVVAAVREVRPNAKQRSLARSLVTGTPDVGVKGARGLIGRSFATVYNAIRRFDAKQNVEEEVSRPYSC